MGVLPQGWLFRGSRLARVSETWSGGIQDAGVIDALVAAAVVHSCAVETVGVPNHVATESEARSLPPVHTVVCGWTDAARVFWEVDDEHQARSFAIR